MSHRSQAIARRGGVLVYSTLVLSLMLVLSLLAVDFGRTRLIKAELQNAADMAARYGASGLAVSTTVARSRAVDGGDDNKAGGVTVSVVSASDVEFGSWNPTIKTFTKLTGAAENGATAIRVATRRRADRGSGVMPLFWGVFGLGSVNVEATAIVTRGKVIAADVEADSCPWLAGMPANSTVAGYDGNTTDAKAPAQSPLRVNSLPLSAGEKLMFRQAGGQTSYDDAGDFGPDGNTDFIVKQRSVNGINATSAPLNALVGIFLDDRAPNTYGQKAELDFTSAASRNFTSLSPGVKQVFFIGDGMDSSGRLQEFVIPAGATRFYLGVMDEKGWWWDNTGSLQTTMLDATITTVR